MREIIEKLLEEVDLDIKELMSRVEERNKKDNYPNWSLLRNPELCILMWQELRDRKKNESLSKL